VVSRCSPARYRLAFQFLADMGQKNVKPDIELRVSVRFYGIQLAPQSRKHERSEGKNDFFLLRCGKELGNWERKGRRSSLGRETFGRQHRRGAYGRYRSNEKLGASGEEASGRAVGWKKAG